MKKIAIIGAGISGLSSAHFLKDHYDVTVFEKESTPGGLIRCERVGDNLFHTCGVIFLIQNVKMYSTGFGRSLKLKKSLLKLTVTRWCI